MLHLTPLKSLLLASALALLAATPASAQEKFRVITTFTVIADMAQNVAGDAADDGALDAALGLGSLGGKQRQRRDGHGKHGLHDRAPQMFAV